MKDLVSEEGNRSVEFNSEVEIEKSEVKSVHHIFFRCLTRIFSLLQSDSMHKSLFKICQICYRKFLCCFEVQEKISSSKFTPNYNELLNHGQRFKLKSTRFNYSYSHSFWQVENESCLLFLSPRLIWDNSDYFQIWNFVDFWDKTIFKVQKISI